MLIVVSVKPQNRLSISDKINWSCEHKHYLVNERLSPRNLWDGVQETSIDDEIPTSTLHQLAMSTQILRLEAYIHHAPCNSIVAQYIELFVKTY